VTEAEAVGAVEEWASVETSGQTVEEAIATALAELGAASDEVSIEVLSRPARVLPGERVSGAAEARVKVSKLDEHTAKARTTLAELLERMGIEARIATRRATPTPGGPTAPPLLDVERYRARREEQVRELALRLANRVKRTGQRYTLDPMHAYERRTIHLTLADDEGVRTESTGKEPARRVVINATGPAQPDLPELPDRAGRPPQRSGGFGDGGRGGDGRPSRWQRG
jgi:spoIIIJ-associated protein